MSPSLSSLQEVPPRASLATSLHMTPTCWASPLLLSILFGSLLRAPVWRVTTELNIPPKLAPMLNEGDYCPSGVWGILNAPPYHHRGAWKNIGLDLDLLRGTQTGESQPSSLGLHILTRNSCLLAESPAPPGGLLWKLASDLWAPSPRGRPSPD